ncbi:uncharacterized protein MYCFIDRAFT_175098 [Pseudocercospora fijiensis CIRAD86]|uniref:Uncharacterized protein n=1 Tax=Pseudocercospora fijiensis (strain CIRAD86) TaxID=383855 RepID=M3AGG6_PSEFD|nr:uncharacterized protein MYCFIDRAFT_175098 [Pseudocercospora fijiensis CIRAD86]EME83671.1 hypothetical protein MYCFIDRAFT_175098 [Pseudocercospora fijiensis CIRAD86]
MAAGLSRQNISINHTQLTPPLTTPDHINRTRPTTQPTSLNASMPPFTSRLAPPSHAPSHAPLPFTLSNHEEEKEPEILSLESQAPSPESSKTSLSSQPSIQYLLAPSRTPSLRTCTEICYSRSHLKVTPCSAKFVWMGKHWIIVGRDFLREGGDDWHTKLVTGNAEGGEWRGEERRGEERRGEDFELQNDILKLCSVALHVTYFLSLVSRMCLQSQQSSVGFPRHQSRKIRDWEYEASWRLRGSDWKSVAYHLALNTVGHSKRHARKGSSSNSSSAGYHSHLVQPILMLAAGNRSSVVPNAKERLQSSPGATGGHLGIYVSEGVMNGVLFCGRRLRDGGDELWYSCGNGLVLRGGDIVESLGCEAKVSVIGVQRWRFTMGCTSGRAAAPFGVVVVAAAAAAAVGRSGKRFYEGQSFLVGDGKIESIPKAMPFGGLARPSRVAANTKVCHGLDAGALVSVNERFSADEGSVRNAPLGEGNRGTNAGGVVVDRLAQCRGVDAERRLASGVAGARRQLLSRQPHAQHQQSPSLHHHHHHHHHLLTLLPHHHHRRRASSPLPLVHSFTYMGLVPSRQLPLSATRPRPSRRRRCLDGQASPGESAYQQHHHFAMMSLACTTTLAVPSIDAPLIDEDLPFKPMWFDGHESGLITRPSNLKPVSCCGSTVADAFNLLVNHPLAVATTSPSSHCRLASSSGKQHHSHRLHSFNDDTKSDTHLLMRTRPTKPTPTVVRWTAASLIPSHRETLRTSLKNTCILFSVAFRTLTHSFADHASMRVGRNTTDTRSTASPFAATKIPPDCQHRFKQHLPPVPHGKLAFPCPPIANDDIRSKLNSNGDDLTVVLGSKLEQILRLP